MTLPLYFPLLAFLCLISSVSGSPGGISHLLLLSLHTHDGRALAWAKARATTRVTRTLVSPALEPASR